MWLITSLVAALTVTALWFMAPEKYRLNLLALMLWGLSVMVLVDHVMGYEGSGPFLEVATEGLIESGLVLGIAMLIPIFIVWEIALAVSKLEMGESWYTNRGE